VPLQALKLSKQLGLPINGAFGSCSLRLTDLTDPFDPACYRPSQANAQAFMAGFPAICLNGRALCERKFNARTGAQLRFCA
jgi:hypothetical protein